MRCLALVAAVGLLALAGAAGAAEQPELVVSCSPGLERSAAAVRALQAEDWGTLLSFLGLRSFTGPIAVALLAENSPEARRVPSYVAAYAAGAVRSVVIFPSRVPSYPDRSLATVLRHEVAHVLIDEVAASRPVPRWLHEGLATVASREWGVEDRARFAAAIIGHRPRSTADLDRGFSEGGAATARSYALSAALVRYLMRRFGEQAPSRLLRRLAEGRPLDEAVALATGVSLPEITRGFFGSEALYAAWIPFLTSSVALWMGITLLALMAMHRRRRRDAALREQWALEDGGGLDVEEPDEGWGEGVVEDDPRRYN